MTVRDRGDTTSEIAGFLLAIFGGSVFYLNGDWKKAAVGLVLLIAGLLLALPGPISRTVLLLESIGRHMLAFRREVKGEKPRRRSGDHVPRHPIESGRDVGGVKAPVHPMKFAGTIRQFAEAERDEDTKPS